MYMCDGLKQHHRTPQNSIRIQMTFQNGLVSQFENKIRELRLVRQYTGIVKVVYSFGYVQPASKDLS